MNNHVAQEFIEFCFITNDGNKKNNENDRYYHLSSTLFFESARKWLKSDQTRMPHATIKLAKYSKHH